MEEILNFLETYEIAIYVILALISIIYIRKLLISLGEYRKSVFGLEKENAIRKIRSTLSVFGLLILMGMTEFLMVSFIVPFYPKSYMRPTATMDILVTPTATLEMTPDTQENTILSDGIEPTMSAEGCIEGQIEWTFPPPGSEISDLVELQGTINVENMGFYKYEYNQMGSDIWTPIAAGNEKKNDESLGGVWNTSQLIPGQYQLRIVVTDNQGTMLPACVLPIYIVAP